MFQSLIKPLTPCVHQAPFIICSFYTLYIYTFRRPLPTLCWMTVSEEEGTVMLAIRLLFSSWTLVDGEMGFASQALGSSHLTFRSLSDCHPLIVGLPSKMRWTTSHLRPSDIPAAGYQRDGKGEKAACSPLCHVPKVNIQQDRTHGFCLTFFPYYLTSSCRPANWERELAPHSRQPDVLPDGGQRSRGFRISSRKSPHYRSTRW